jgi:hypothetical protein
VGIGSARDLRLRRVTPVQCADHPQPAIERPHRVALAVAAVLPDLG